METKTLFYLNMEVLLENIVDPRRCINHEGGAHYNNKSIGRFIQHPYKLYIYIYIYIPLAIIDVRNNQFYIFITM